MFGPLIAPVGVGSSSEPVALRAAVGQADRGKTGADGSFASVFEGEGRATASSDAQEPELTAQGGDEAEPEAQAAEPTDPEAAEFSAPEGGADAPDGAQTGQIETGNVAPVDLSGLPTPRADGSTAQLTSPAHMQSDAAAPLIPDAMAELPAVEAIAAQAIKSAGMGEVPPPPGSGDAVIAQISARSHATGRETAGPDTARAPGPGPDPAAASGQMGTDRAQPMLQSPAQSVEDHADGRIWPQAGPGVMTSRQAQSAASVQSSSAQPSSTQPSTPSAPPVWSAPITAAHLSETGLQNVVEAQGQPPSKQSASDPEATPAASVGAVAPRPMSAASPVAQMAAIMTGPATSPEGATAQQVSAQTAAPVTEAEASAASAPRTLPDQPAPPVIRDMARDAPRRAVMMGPEGMGLRVTQAGGPARAAPDAAPMRPETRFSYPIDMSARMWGGGGDKTATVTAQTVPNAPIPAAAFAVPGVAAPDPARPDAFERGGALDAMSGAADLRGTGSTSFEPRTGPHAPPAQAETARQVAMQIAEAVRSGEKPIEMILNPAELGRVRLSLAPGDGIMMVTVLAERPETLDLMRRHIDMLAQELRNIGYGSTSFSFAGGTGGDAPPHFDAEGGGGDAATSDEITHPVATAAPLAVTDRLDIRL